MVALLMPATSPGGFVFHVALKPLRSAVLEVLAQQHAGPVAGLGAAGAGLDVDKAVQRVGRVAEHAAELELLHRRRAAWRLRPRWSRPAVVAFFLAHLEELGVVGQLAV
jgi:hypothetical protein